MFQLLHTTLKSRHSSEMLLQKRSRPKKMKIIRWSLPLLRLGKSLPTTRTLKLEILCFFCHGAVSDKQKR